MKYIIKMSDETLLDKHSCAVRCEEENTLNNKDESSIGAVWIMKTIKIKIKNFLKSKIKDFIFNSTMVKAVFFSELKRKIKVIKEKSL